MVYGNVFTVDTRTADVSEIGFVCVGDAGRSPIPTVFAERERERRGLDDVLEVVAGGTEPTDAVREDEIEAMREEGTDGTERAPRHMTTADGADAEFVVTMGCSVDGFVPDDWDGAAGRWERDRPGGDDRDAVRSQRDERRRRVEGFFDRIDSAIE